jgi:heat shock protein HslJ
VRCTRLAGIITAMALAGCSSSGTPEGKAAPESGSGRAAPPPEARVPDATLANTYWKLVEIGGEPLVLPADANVREPNLRLTLQQEARGETGCNSFSGRYQQRGDSLRMGPLASTRRACLDERMNRQEHAYVTALEATRSWKVTGDTLWLSGEAGEVARFEAVYMR